MIYALAIFLSIVPSILADGGWWAGPGKNTFIGVSVGANGQEIYGTGYNAGSHGFLLYQDQAKNQYWYNISGVPMDVALSNDGSTVVVASSSGMNVGYSATNFSATVNYNPGYFACQHVAPFGAVGFAGVGRFNTSNGVAISKNGGLTWTAYDIGLSVEQGYKARYGAFPTTTTWYVTSGTWPFDSDFKRKNAVVARLSGRLSLYFDADGNGDPKTTYISARNLLGTYPGAISKTTDGGLTWTKVHDSNGKYYLNQIDCIDANNCVAVGEDAKSAIALKTCDGGATWTTILQLHGPYSLHAVQMASVNEYFIAGGAPSSGPYSTKDIVGHFRHTTDGGATWTDTFNGYGYDLNLNQGTLLGVAMLKYQSEIVIYSETVTKTVPN